MSDRYLASNNGVGVYDLWEHDENGQRVRLVSTLKADTQWFFEGMLDTVREMNRLERLVDDSVNHAHLTDRTLVQHALLKRNIGKKEVAEMETTKTPRYSDHTDAFIVVRRDYWNRMVRTLKEISGIVWPT